MYRFIYSFMLSKYGVIYLGTVRKDISSKVIYGYNKLTDQYSFWRVSSNFKLYLLEVCCSKSKALFSYRILNKGVD